MSRETSVEMACEQILFCLKKSNLNYVIKETPFSANVTIRKKFINSANINALRNESKTNIEIMENVKKLENINQELQMKNKGLLSELGHLRIEFEIKYKNLENERSSFEKQLDDAVDQNEILKKELKNINLYNTELEKEMKKVTGEKVNLVNKMIDFEKEVVDKTNLVDVLETTVQNKVLEIERIKEELEKLHEFKYSCIFCDYKTDQEESLKKHVSEKHDWKCRNCDMAFESSSKLREVIIKKN